MLNDHARDLINRALDGELSESERPELEGLLTGSEEARSYSEGLTKLAGILGSVPAVEPPTSLQREILSQIQLPRPHRWFTRSAGWMQGRPVSYGIAAAAGLLAAVAFYELSPAARPFPDLSSMVGTLVRGNSLGGVIELSYIDIDLPAVKGKVSLRGSGDLKLLRFDVESGAPVDFEVGLTGSGLTFGGFAQEADGGTDTLLLSEGKFMVSNLGPQRFTVILRDSSGEGTVNGGIVISVRQDGEALYQGVLSL